LNLSVWPNGEPSYLARWNGSGWENVRQLPELVETNGQFSERISLDELRGAAALPVAPTIGVTVATWSGNDVNAPPDDALPDGERWAPFQIQPTTVTTTTTTTTTTTSSGGHKPRSFSLDAGQTRALAGAKPGDRVTCHGDGSVVRTTVPPKSAGTHGRSASNKALKLTVRWSHGHAAAACSAHG
jgi:hypothetical protein